MVNATKKILVVEDDKTLREVIVGNLKKKNYEIVEANDGEAGIAMVLDEKPKLVLLDLLLPKLDGFKVLERIRHYPDKNIAETKVVVLSNLYSDKDILRAQALKVDEYYAKANTDLNVVFQKIDQIMAG
ncbi:MAG: response regulator [Patescibacteria group bacterium]|nr:response regulator [Patescibacteria group bacterium]